MSAAAATAAPDAGSSSSSSSTPDQPSWAASAAATPRYLAALEARDAHFRRTVEQIIRTEGSLHSFCFANGLHFYGLQRSNLPHLLGWFFREWAPAALSCSLVGEFNGWDASRHVCQRRADGTFEVFVADVVSDEADGGGGGACGHRSQLRPGDKYKIALRIRTPSGAVQLVHRVPAWARCTQQDPITGEICAIVPLSDPLEYRRWRHERPAPSAAPALRIYEVHVGICSSEPIVAGWTFFRLQVLPRVAALGYTALLLMAVQEHAYYGSFGYQVTSFFAPSSRFGTPAELQALIDAAHGLGLRVLFELVQAHASSNTSDGLNRLDGSNGCYFLEGADGWHPEWRTRMFDFGKVETLRFLLAQVCYFAEAYRVDGFRFDAVSAALYRHRSLGGRGKFERGDEDYFGEGCMLDVDALTYFKLANLLTHELVRPSLITIAEEHSCLPGLCAPVPAGGVGFDYRQAMGLPNVWAAFTQEHMAVASSHHSAAIDMARAASPQSVVIMADRSTTSKEEDEEQQQNVGRALTTKVTTLVRELCLRRPEERRLAYVECHDQSIVGGQSLAFRLMGAAMARGMSVADPPGSIVSRGMALHKMSRLLTYSLGGEAYLNFVGNEFGHPDWVDLPRKGNRDSSDKARRLWPLADDPQQRYGQLEAFDRALHSAHQKAPWLDRQAPDAQRCACCDACELIWFQRGACYFAFNFHPTERGAVSFALPHALRGGEVVNASTSHAELLIDAAEQRFGGDGHLAEAHVVMRRVDACKHCGMRHELAHERVTSNEPALEKEEREEHEGRAAAPASFRVVVPPLSATVAMLRLRGSGSQQPPPPPSATKSAAAVASLLSWAASNGFYVSKGIEVAEIPGAGLGVRATRRLHKGELIVRAPHHMMLVGKDEDDLALKLLVEARRAPAGTSTFWTPYLHSLPSTATLGHPLLYPSQRLLEGTEAQNRSAFRIDYVRRLHKRWADALAAATATSSSSSSSSSAAVVSANGGAEATTAPAASAPLLTKDEVEWAVAITWSRGFGVTQRDAKGGQKALPALIPVGDIFNHAQEAQENLETYSLVDRSLFDFVTTRPVEAGEELVFRYGRTSEPGNRKLWIDYGFCIPFNFHDEVEVRLLPDVQEDDEEAEDKEDALRRQLLKALRVDDYARSAALTLLGDATQPPQALIASGRVLALRGPGLAAATPATILDEQPAAFERAAFFILAEKIRARLMLYPPHLPSIAEDERTLASGAWRQSGGPACALHLRASERRILQHWLHVCSWLAGEPERAAAAAAAADNSDKAPPLSPSGPALHTFKADATFTSSSSSDAPSMAADATLEVRVVGDNGLRGVVMARGSRLRVGQLAGCYTGRAIPRVGEATAKLHMGFEAYSFPVNATHVMDPTDANGEVAANTRHEMALVNEPNGDELPNLWPMDYAFGKCVDRDGVPGVAYVVARDTSEGEELTVCYGRTYAFRSSYRTICAESNFMQRWTALQQRVVGARLLYSS